MSVDNPASREGYADEWTDEQLKDAIAESQPFPHHAKPHHLDTQQTPPVVQRYQTPGPGPSAGIPKSDLELSKIEKQVEDIRAILAHDASLKASNIKSALWKIELSTAYLKGLRP